MRKKCLDTIYELAKKNKKIIFIGSDLGPNVLDSFKKKFPNRFFMEGVSEQSIIGIAAGMAMEGNIPFVNTISTFLTRRCYEQIVIDLCLHNLPVKLVGNGGGLVYAPLGPTHQAIEDFSIMRVIPNMSIVAPCDEVEMEMLVRDSLKLKSPLYIRIARGGEEIISSKKVDIKNKSWIVINPSVTKEKETTQKKNEIILETNFDKERISTLFSNLSWISLVSFVFNSLERVSAEGSPNLMLLIDCIIRLAEGNNLKVAAAIKPIVGKKTFKS